MELNLGRIGTLLSDRIVLREKPNGDLHLTVANSLVDWLVRIISWIYAPQFYTDENRRTITAFLGHFVRELGPDRLKRIANRYSIDLERMRQEGSSLLSRHVAQIRVGIEDVTILDMVEECQGQSVETLSRQEFALLREKLATLPQDRLSIGATKVRDITVPISGRASQFWARVQYDPLLADRERKHLCEINATLDRVTFYHHCAVRVIKKEPEVGMLIQGPNHLDGGAQFYRVAAKLVTGEGRVNYTLVPATKDTELPIVRIERGSAYRTGEADGISTIIAGADPEIGRAAFEASREYDQYLTPLSPEVLVGHSLGGAFVSLQLAENIGSVKEAYIFNAPGVSQEVVEQFNRQIEHSGKSLTLVIRHSIGDPISRLGEAHLGGRGTPATVAVDYRRYKFAHGLSAGEAHTLIPLRGPERTRYHGIQGGHSEEELNEHFLNRGTRQERLRKKIGPTIAKMARCFRDLLRKRVGARELSHFGLQIGTFTDHQYQFQHIRPSDIIVA